MNLHTAALLSALLLLPVGGATGCVSAKRQKQAAARVDLGAAYLRENNPAAAVGTLEEAVKFDKRNWEAWTKLALAYSASGAPRKSEEAFEKALKLVPGEAEVLNNYGLMLMSEGRLDEAVERLDEGRSDLDYRRMAMLLSNLGYALYLKGDLDTAMERLDEAVRRGPSLCQARFNRGMVAAARKEHTKAIEDFETVIQLCGDEVVGAYYHAGLTLEAMNDLTGACAYYGTVVSQAPGTDVARAATARRAEACP